MVKELYLTQGKYNFFITDFFRMRIIDAFAEGDIAIIRLKNRA
jgi:hypothetical protein